MGEADGGELGGEVGSEVPGIVEPLETGGGG